MNNSPAWYLFEGDDKLPECECNSNKKAILFMKERQMCKLCINEYLIKTKND